MISVRIFSIPTILFLILTCSCNNSKQGEKSFEELESKNLREEVAELIKEEVIESVVVEPNNIKYEAIDSTIREAIQTLDNKHVRTPFFVRLNGRNFYITCTGEYNYRMDRFDGTLKYGLVNDSLEILLESVVDKIYNPNTTLINCFEIKQNSMVGFCNYQTGEILQPQFDYILPSANKANGIAYGYKNQQWFEINNTQISRPVEVDFDASSVLKTLSFNVLNIGESMMFDSYSPNMNRDTYERRGVVIVPSYVEYFNLLPHDSYTDVILPNQVNTEGFGTEHAELKTSLDQNVTDRIISFLVSIYESGIDARGYQMEAKELIVYNKESNTLTSIHLGELYQNDYFCSDSGYRFVNDSIVEVKSNISKYESKNQRYDFETNFKYHKITKDGSIIELSSDRYYDFTKFIYMDESNLNGCFAWRIDDSTYNGNHNMWITDHVNIEDLDMMRNEIFAEYGYKFKTEKWQKYFLSKPWYKPLHDDVDEKLTEMDKANIKVILKVKDQMQENSASLLNKRRGTYAAAG